MPFIDSEPADAAIHALAIRLARQCRHVVQACLREEEFHDCDMEFYRVIRTGLEENTDSWARNATQFYNREG